MVTVDRGRYTLLFEGRTVTAMKSRPLGRKGVVVGDRVRVVGDTSGADGSLARIVEVNERTTTLRRTADDDDPVERVIVSNAEQLVVVTALADPEPAPRLIDRALVAAYDARMTPVLCLTKADLADPETLLATYRHLDVEHVVTQRGGDLDAVRAVLAGRSSVLVGHSGVGKSTLVNALVPEAHREVGIVNAVTGRGRHTSTSAYMLPLPGDEGGWIIDTPGIRSFGLAHIDPDRLIGAFPDLEAETDVCPARLLARRGRARVRPRRGDRGGDGRTRRGWSRSGGCWPPARATRTERLAGGARPDRASDSVLACRPCRCSGYSHRLHRRPAPRARARRRRRLADPDPLQGARPARDEQAGPDARDRRGPRRRGGHPAHAVAGPLPRRGGRRGAGHHRAQPAAVDRRPDRRHQELRPRRAGVGHADRAGRRRRGGARRGLGAAAAAPLVGVGRATAPGPAARCSRRPAARSPTSAGSRTRRSSYSSLVAAGTSAAGSTTSCRCPGACWRTRAYGDFWSYMLLAEGAVDIAAEPELELYDMAALDIIVREAGGRFTSLDGTAGPFGGNALATNGHLHEAALASSGSLPDGDDDDPRRRGRAAVRGVGAREARRAAARRTSADQRPCSGTGDRASVRPSSRRTRRSHAHQRCAPGQAPPGRGHHQPRRQRA